MKALRWGRRLFVTGLLLYVLTCAVIYGTHLLNQTPGPARMSDEPIRVVIVLGGGARPDGKISHASRLRVRRAIAVAGSADGPVFILSGGQRSLPFGPTSAALMGDLALNEGLVPAQIVLEPSALSTFQNLFQSLPIADRLGAAADGRDILLVTDSTHILRSRLLMRFFGRSRVQLATSNAFADYRLQGQVRTILREAAACWYNLAKVLLWQGLGLAGFSESERLSYIE